MDGEAVKALGERFRAPIELGGFIVRPTDWVAEDPAALIKAGPAAKALTVSTLGAACDYATANRDGLDMTKVVVHVGAPNAVALYGPLDARSRAREMFVWAAIADSLESWLGKFLPLEEFLIGRRGSSRPRTIASGCCSYSAPSRTPT